MNSKKTKFVENIYTSYGPYVGKVCENTNTQLCEDNVINSLTSSVHENLSNPNIDSINMKYPNMSKIDDIKNSPQELPNIRISNQENISIPIDKLNNVSNKNTPLKTGGDILNNQETNTNNTVNDEESYGFFNYKISIFNHKISIWIIILILLVIACIAYFIYKYWYLKNTSIITYKKNSTDINDTDKNNDNKNNKNDNLSESSDSSNSSKSSKSDHSSSKSSKNTESTK